MRKLPSTADIYDAQRIAYRDAVLQIHISGQMDVAAFYEGVGYRPKGEHDADLEEPESDLDYIAGIAEQDFEDGTDDAACFQEIYDRVTRDG